MKTHTITREEYEAVLQASKQNKNKRIDKRLQVIILRYEGLKDREIGERLGYHRQRVSQLCAQFKRIGVSSYAQMKYGGNHRSMSLEEEAEILNSFRARAEQGQMITVQEMKAEFDERLGRDTGRGYIYMLLKRHGWRKIMPRSKHPKKASEEEIAASKKLTLPSSN